MNLRSFLLDEDRGVSPVIGVILMVDITVILADVIAAFVLDLGQGMSSEAQAGTSVSSSGDEVIVTWTSEGNSDDILVSASIDDAQYGVYDGTDVHQEHDINLGTVASSATFKITGDTDHGSVASDSDVEGDTVEVDFILTATSGDQDTVVQQTTETVTISEAQ